MLTPNEYKVREDVTARKLLYNKFIDRSDYYSMYKQLYGNYISLSLFINKEDLALVVNVHDNNGYTYSPFYNPDDRHNNLVYKEVIRNYNNFMDRLVEKKILEYDRKEYVMNNKFKYTYEDLEGFFVGSFLGDGAFVKKSDSHNTYVVFKHCESQIQYLEWKYDFLNKFWLTKEAGIKPVKLVGCYENAQNQFYFSTKSCDRLNKFKTISKKDIIKKFNEMALSVYVLDDGSFYEDRCKISCGVLDKFERNELCDTFKEKFKIECSVYTHPTDNSKDYFVIKKENCKKLIDIILSKIPSDIDIINEKIINMKGRKNGKN